MMFSEVFASFRVKIKFEGLIDGVNGDTFVLGIEL